VDTDLGRGFFGGGRRRWSRSGALITGLVYLRFVLVGECEEGVGSLDSK